LGAVLIGVLGERLRKPLPGIIASGAVLAAFIVSLLSVLQMAGREPRVIQETAYRWINVGTFEVNAGFWLDPLSAVMILVVTGIGFLIHVYSIGYMSHDENDPQSTLYGRYFAFLNLFIAFMSLLVLADNYLLMFVGWEGVGLCSYFLIGFWYKREEAALASQKAFVMNRIGDCGFLLGLMLLFLAAGSLNYDAVLNVARTNPAAFSTGIVGAMGGIGLITLLLFVGATGKSAQIPLFTWLPDAMAGPTPVSALIHAATMVTAGVYVCARSAALFDLAPTTKLIICGVGALTALAAGLTALAHTDIKKVLAYSTVSQLGFMFMAVGAGAYVAAIFHVFTHAFFKACLFLAAGSVIHALHGEQDMRKMGGLASKMKATHLTFLVSSLALAGAVPFAGFFSKDEILAGVWAAGSNQSLYMLFCAVGLLTALITALYSGRQYAQIFAGQPRDAHLFEHAHESPSVMTVPLWILGAGAVLVGFLGVPHIPGVPAMMHGFANWLAPVFESTSHGAGAHGGGAHGTAHDVNWALIGIGAIIGWGGWLAGRTMGTDKATAALPESTSSLSLDRAYNSTLVPAGFGLAQVMRWVDERVIDGVVNGLGALMGQMSQTLRMTQTAYVRNYALGMAVGAAVILGLFFVRV
jgi:NADH-quinone oxidoreductase subunit L